MDITLIIFKNPWFLFLSPVVIIFVFLLKKRSRSPAFRFSSSELIKELNPTLRIRLRSLLKYLRAASMFFVILALARPQSPSKGAVLDVKGIDIVLTIDASTSMLAEDFNIENQRVNRLDVTKMAISDFISKRHGQRGAQKRCSYM